MATKKVSATEECCAKCERDIMTLKREIAGLKKELAKKTAGAPDLRVDKLIEALKKESPRFKNCLNKANL